MANGDQGARHAGTIALPAPQRLAGLDAPRFSQASVTMFHVKHLYARTNVSRETFVDVQRAARCMRHVPRGMSHTACPVQQAACRAGAYACASKNAFTLESASANTRSSSSVRPASASSIIWR